MSTFALIFTGWMVLNVGIVIGFGLSALFRANGELSSDGDLQR